MTDSTHILIIKSKSGLSGKLAPSLEESGFVLTVVHDHIEARMILDDSKPNIIIMDELLTNGPDSIRACCLLQSNYDIPVILLRKDSSGTTWMLIAEPRANLYFAVPSDHRELIDTVKAVLQRSKTGMAVL